VCYEIAGMKIHTTQPMDDKQKSPSPEIIMSCFLFAATRPMLHRLHPAVVICRNYFNQGESYRKRLFI
jgi:hypothetical protein